MNKVWRTVVGVAASMLLLSACTAGPDRAAAPQPDPAGPTLIQAPPSPPELAAPQCGNGDRIDTSGTCVHRGDDGFDVDGNRVHDGTPVPATRHDHGAHEHPTGNSPQVASREPLTDENRSDYGAPVVPVACHPGGNGIEFLYVYAAGAPNNIELHRPAMVRAVEQANGVFHESSAGQRTMRVVTDQVGGTCVPRITAVEMPESELWINDTLSKPLRKMGIDAKDRKYFTFVDFDKRVVCGLGQFPATKGNSKWNQANTGPNYARSDSHCWTAETVAHEVTHTLGAVSNTSPNASGALHCRDEHDLMCYTDEAGQPTFIKCADQHGEALMDCGGDDYFNLAPPAGTWLGRNWNVAQSSFLYGGGPAIPTTRPTKPRQLRLTATSRTTAKVSWKPARNVEYYTVYDYRKAKWVKLTSNKRSYTYKGLRPYARYHVQVYAVNPHGKSQTPKLVATTRR